MSMQKKLFSKNLFVFNLVALGVIFGFVIAFAYFTGFGRALPGKKAYAQESTAAAMDASSYAQAQALQNVFRQVSKNVLPVVVEINVTETTTQNAPQGQGNEFPWNYFFGNPNDNGGNNAPQQRQSHGLGSGVIVRKIGSTYYVLTNNHVAGNASDIKIQLNDGREFTAKLVGKDDRKDVALVSFEPKDDSIPVAILGDSNVLQVGDITLAVGNPFGFVSSVTMGIVSALQRNGGPDNNINDFIQTDASINQGNSGGALVNIRGEVIGINTWIASPTGGSIGLGFAIPINNLKKAIDDFINKGKVQYGWLGVSLSDADKDFLKDAGIGDKSGAFVSQVFIDSPADKGGMLPGDFVTRLNGHDVKDTNELVRLVGDLPAGKDAAFSITRDGKSVDLNVRIEARDDKIATNNAKLWPGTIVVPLTDEIRKQFDIASDVKGLYVAQVSDKTPASSMGLRDGDVVTKVNDKAVSNIRDFYKAINTKGSKTFTFERNGSELTTTAFRH
jgi:Do/DeqQ family serine protease